MALILRYRMNDNAASTVVHDSSGSGNHGTLTGAGNTSASTTTGPGAPYTAALDFDGTDDRVAVGTPIELTGDWSITAWVKKDVDHSGLLCAADIADNFDMIVLANAAAGIVSVQTGEENIVAELSYTPDTAWHHYAITFANSTDFFRLYEDGVEIATHDLSDAESLIVGGVAGFAVGPSAELNGKLADFRVYDELLSAGTISDIFDGTNDPAEPGGGSAVPVFMNQYRQRWG